MLSYRCSTQCSHHLFMYVCMYVCVFCFVFCGFGLPVLKFGIFLKKFYFFFPWSVQKCLSKKVLLMLFSLTLLRSQIQASTVNCFLFTVTHWQCSVRQLTLRMFLPFALGFWYSFSQQQQHLEAKQGIYLRHI